MVSPTIGGGRHDPWRRVHRKEDALEHNTSKEEIAEALGVAIAVNACGVRLFDTSSGFAWTK
jgi:hypothetical protein